MKSIMFNNGIDGYEEFIPSELQEGYEAILDDSYEGGDAVLLSSSGIDVGNDEYIIDLLRDYINTDDEYVLFIFAWEDDDCDIDEYDSGFGIMYIGTAREILEELDSAEE